MKSQYGKMSRFEEAVIDIINLEWERVKLYMEFVPRPSGADVNYRFKYSLGVIYKNLEVLKDLNMPLFKKTLAELKMDFYRIKEPSISND